MNSLIFEAYFYEFLTEWLTDVFMDDRIFFGSEYLPSSQEKALERIFRGFQSGVTIQNLSDSERKMKRQIPWAAYCGAVKSWK